MKWRIATTQDGFSPEEVERCTRALRAARTGIIPTDTVYGIAALATDPDAVSRILEIKERPPDKPLPVQADSLESAARLAAFDDPIAWALARSFWPGALTLVLKRRGRLELPFQDDDTIGIRVPASAVCRALAGEAGFLVVPSANPPGMASPVEPSVIDRRMIDAADFMVDAGPCPGGVESTVVSLLDGIKVLREGAIPAETIMRAVRRAAGEESD